MRRALALSLLVLPSAARADGAKPDCATAVTQADMNICAEQAWKAADEDLNLAYGLAVAMMQSIDAGLSEGQRGAEDALRAGQRAWVAFRDAGCTSEGYRVRGGSLEPLVVATCRERVTRARTEDLRALAETN